MNYNLLYQWIRIKQRGLSLSLFFYEYGIKKVVILGENGLQTILDDELTETGIEVVALGDLTNGNYYYESIRESDAVVLVLLDKPYFYANILYDDIGEVNVYSLEEILFELSYIHKIPFFGEYGEYLRYEF